MEYIGRYETNMTNSISNRPSAMLQYYLKDESCLTGRLVAGSRAPDAHNARAEVQTMLDEWEARFGRPPNMDAWQQLLNKARTYTMVEELRRQLEQDLQIVVVG